MRYHITKHVTGPISQYLSFVLVELKSTLLQRTVPRYSDRLQVESVCVLIGTFDLVARDDAHWSVEVQELHWV